MKTFAIVMAIFLVIGLALLAGAVAVWRSHVAFAAHAISARGVVEDLSYSRSSSSASSGTYRPVVQFKAPNGDIIHITGSTGSNPSSYSRGDKVRVLFDPTNPEGARIDSFTENWLLIVILAGIGAIFTLIGGGVIVSTLRKRSTHRWLQANGMRVQAKYEGVTTANIKVNNRSLYQLKAQWQHPVTRLVYVFLSDPVTFDPEPYVKRETLEVLVNADNPKQYHVDTSFLPKAG